MRTTSNSHRIERLGRGSRRDPRSVALPLCALFALALGTATPVFAQVKAGITVDFAKERGRQKSMAGMIHGAVPRPDDVDRTIPAFSRFIDPLDFRVWSEGANMAHNGYLGMVEGTHPETRSFLRLGGGLVKKCPYTGSKDRPYDTPNEYKAYLRCATAWARDAGVSVLDVWNEPNLHTFTAPLVGDKTKLDYFLETFKIAHETILDEWPGAVIAGPSLGKVNQDLWLEEFMNYCEREELEVPILTWHENGTRNHAAKFPALEGKIRAAREKYILGPDYPHVGVREIVINEIGAQKFNDYPASHLALFYYLENGGADGSARSCWPIPGASCFENTLNGLVSLPDEDGVQQKLSSWWMMFYYKKSLLDRVDFRSDFQNLVGMANPRQLLLGLYEEPDFTERTGLKQLKVEVTLKNLEMLPWFTDDMTSLIVKKREIAYEGPSQVVRKVPVKSRQTVSIRTAEDGTKRATFSSNMDVHSILVFEFDPTNALAGNSNVTRTGRRVAATKASKKKSKAGTDKTSQSAIEDPAMAKSQMLQRKFHHTEAPDR